jgi:hypothetical protein
LKFVAAVHKIHGKGFKRGGNENGFKGGATLKCILLNQRKERTGLKPDGYQTGTSAKAVVAQRNNRGRNAK